jgi:eukaryotic-like serine/threonine-protein kinase
LTEATQPGDLPSAIGKYEIVSRVGRGAMGVVYHARDPLLDRDVALKVMLPQIAGDPDQKGRFEREARAVAKIVHPNVLTVFDLGYHHDGSPYIAMELLKGQDLLHILRSDWSLALERKVDIVVQLLDGLACAHQAGIVHRDVKPANIFLTVDGTVKIMDFGVARFTMSSNTGTGAVMGTADYMSPEQVQGAKVDGRTDLWSAGCVLYQLLTGHRPFTGESLMTVFYKITHADPAMELPAGPEHEALRQIVLKSLARNADERYQTAAEFAGDLRAFRKTFALPAPQVVAPAPPEAPAAAPQAAAAPAAKPPKPPPIDLLDALAGEARAAVTAPPTIGLSKPPAVVTAPEAPAAAEPAPPIPTVEPVPATADPTPLFQMMRNIYVGAKSGHLHFTHGHDRRSLYFVRGLILYGTSDVQGEHLGNTLVRYGLMSQEDLERATPAVLRDRKRLGNVMQELGMVDQAGLDEAIALHVRDLLFTVLDRGAGSFGFEEMSGDDTMGLTAHIRPGQMILEAARRLQAPEVMKQVLGDLDRPLGMSSHPLLGVQKLTLSPIDGFLLSRIDGVITAREIFQITPLPEEDTERSLFALLCTGTVEYVPRTATWRARAAAAAGAESPSPASAAPAPEPAPASPSTPAPSPTSKSDAGRSLKDETDREDARRNVEARRSEILDAFAGLQGRDHFELLGIERKASENEVKEAYFRLARKFHPDTPLDPALADLRPKRENVFLRLAAAYETLRNPQSRAHYERMVEARSPRRQPEAPAASPPAAPAAGPVPPLEPKARAVGEERQQNAAQEAVPNATRLIKEEKYWDAIQVLEPALPFLEGPARLKARILLARAYLKNPNWVRQAETTLREVLREKPDLAEAHVVLGLVYRTTNLRSRALASYRKALELDPENEEAPAEIAALGSPDEAPPPSSLRSKLFGKR